MSKSNLTKNWNDYFNTVKQTNQAVVVLFSNYKAENNVWEWLTFLEQEMFQFKPEKMATAIDASFFYAMIESLDLDSLRAISASLESINSLLPGAGLVAPVLAKPNYPAEWLGICGELDLSKDITNAFLARLNSLPRPLQGEAINILRVLHDSYLNFKAKFQIIAAALLYYMPKDTPVTLEDWKKLVRGSKDALEKKQQGCRVSLRP